MRLFGKVDGHINRFDRAGWLTTPFDLAFAISNLIFRRTPYTARVGCRSDQE